MENDSPPPAQSCFKSTLNGAYVQSGQIRFMPCIKPDNHSDSHDILIPSSLRANGLNAS